MISGIKFQLNSELYLRDPQETKLGQNILKHSIELIDDIGLEGFTFKKLAKEIGSTEASIYRYFDNKHSILLFLTCWYWEWVHYLISVNMINITDPEQKLKIAIHNIVNASSETAVTSYINQNRLHRIIINEGSKAYHTHLVDDENTVGVFSAYKTVVQAVADIMIEITPTFAYPHSLASNLFEMANNQIFFAEHLPKLTDIKNGEDLYPQIEEMMALFALKIIKD